ncbi:MAG: GNVR domain-containing protein [Polyangiaceae bacterium]
MIPAPSDRSGLNGHFHELEPFASERRSRRWVPTPRGDRIELGQVGDLLQHRWRFILAVAALLFAAVIVFTLLSPMAFRSSGRLYLGELGEPERRSAQSAEAIDLSGDAHADVESEIEIITSRSLIARAIYESGLNVALTHAGWKPVRYWQWRSSGRDASLLESAPRELTVVAAALAPTVAKPRKYELSFTSSSEYDLIAQERVLAHGRLGEPLDFDGLSLSLESGVDGTPEAGARFEIVLTPIEAVIDRVLGVLDVSAPKSLGASEPAKVVTLRFAAETPAIAARFLRRLMLAYLEQRQFWKTENATAAEEFVTRQLSGMRGSLDQIEQKLADYRTSNRVVVQDNEGKAMTEQLGKYEEQRVKARLEVAALSNIQLGLRDPNPPVEAYLLGEAEDNVLEGLATSLSKARQELTDLEARFNPSAPDVREQQAQVEAQLGAIRNYVGSRLKRAQHNLESLNGIIGQFERRLTSVPGAELGLAQLSRESEVYGRLYSYLLERQQQTAIVKASTISKNRILDEPQLAHREATPKLVFALGSLPLGLLLGVALVLLRGFLGRSFQGERDIRRGLAGLPVFASVPRYHAPLRRRPSRLPDPIFDPQRDLDPQFVEAFRTLRTHLYGSLPNGACGVVLITSPSAGDGKTTCALALAALLAADGRRVLLLDADLRQPIHHVLLGSTTERDLGSVLGGKSRLRDAVWQARLPAGQCHAVGALKPLSVELLTGDGMRRLLAEARASYDFVIVDAPSLPAVSDAVVLAAQVDCVLSVVRTHHTERRLADEHIERLHPLTEVHGLVLNCTERRSLTRGARPVDAVPIAGRELALGAIVEAPPANEAAVELKARASDKDAKRAPASIQEALRERGL